MASKNIKMRLRKQPDQDLTSGYNHLESRGSNSKFNASGSVVLRRQLCVVVALVVLLVSGDTSLTFSLVLGSQQNLSFQTIAYLKCSSPTAEKPLAPIVPLKYVAESLHSWEVPPPVVQGSAKEGHGEQGKAVVIAPSKKKEMDEKFKEHQFNIMASDIISVNRTLADSRHPK